MSEYDDEEWLDDGGADAGDESDSEGLVHPLPHRQAEKQLDDNKNLDKPKRVSPRPVLSATSDSDDGASENEAVDVTSVNAPCTPRAGAKYADAVVRLHARRINLVREVQKDSVCSPPPAPVTTTITDVGRQASVEAQKRIHAYRRRVAQKGEEQKNQMAQNAQAAQQVRAMHKNFNRTIGVADIPPSDRYKNAIRIKRLEKQKKDQAAAEETATRWYRNVDRPTRSDINGAKILEDARQDHHAKVREKALHRRTITNKLKQLSVKTKKIVTQSGGEYERGSFVLKVRKDITK